MMIDRVTEAEIDFYQTTFDFLNSQVDFHSKGFQCLGAPTLAGVASVSVFGHLGSGCCSNDRRTGRDVEGADPVSPGTAGIDDILRRIDF